MADSERVDAKRESERVALKQLVPLYQEKSRLSAAVDENRYFFNQMGP